MAWCNPAHVVCMNFPCRTSETEYYQVQNGIRNILGPATFGILAVATIYVSQSGGSQAAVAYTSVGIAFLTFVGIVTYHIYIQIKSKVQYIQCGHAEVQIRLLVLKLIFVRFTRDLPVHSFLLSASISFCLPIVR